MIQHIYDSHYEGAESAADYVRQWNSLKGRIDEERYADVLERLEYQAGHAIVWRDAICNWFFRASGIPDAKGRVGHHAERRASFDPQRRLLSALARRWLHHSRFCYHRKSRGRRIC